ncbi:coiled-coil domain-containing protein [Alkaliphilus serpentinus]|uniref:Peptidoglycan hydrolase PcsB coiled-coil domain-containing protein n=1 Tax=Alkaliphilus serpentinus TaxID=1482731 RepID=A0A833HLS0_9FIRM|nr:hypothetical protein [Alkaliphilus serpentinus]KAB3526354.1 hypothetical protein F8153_13930 [Alkaliphilus serpentinus]
MVKGKRRYSVIFLLLGMIAFFGQQTNFATGQMEPHTEIHERLKEISEEERRVLESLFTLTQDIEAMEMEEEEITQEIDEINKEMRELEELLSRQEVTYSKKRKDLELVLQSYQRRGPGTYLEILLNSQSLGDFLRRLNTLRDLTKNTGDLLEEMEESKAQIQADKLKLDSMGDFLLEKQQDLRETLISKNILKEELNQRLAALEDEREVYQRNLENVTLLWNQLKPLFIQVTGEFTTMIEEGNLPPEALETTFQFPRIKGTINEDAFNHLIEDNAKLPELEFSFNVGAIEMSLPSHRLLLQGSFQIVDGNILRYVVKEGAFYGLPLEDASLEELFKEGYLEINLKPLLGKNRITSIEMKDGYIEMLVVPVFF